MNKIFKTFIFTVSILLITQTSAFSIEEASKVYFLHDCIETAIKNSPVIKKAKYDFETAKSDLGIAKSGYFPTLGAGIGYIQYVNSTNNYDDGYSKRLLPDVQVYLDQLIYDFGKTTAGINMEKFYKIAAEYRYNDSICETINAVKVAYFNALEALAAVDVEKNNLLINEMISNKTKELYNSGTKSETDYINSKVYLATAKIRLTDAINAYNAAIADLCNAMYIDDIGEIKIKSINEFNYVDAYFTPEFVWGKDSKGNLWRRPDPVTGEKHQNTEYAGDIVKLPFTLQEAYDSAEKNNPELKVLESTLDAMKQYALTVKRNYYPSLKGRVGYGYDGKYISQKDPIKNNQLNVAVTLDSSVNILQTKYETDKVNMQVKSAENDIEMFRKNIHYEIKKAYADVETAQKQIENSKDKVQNAIENLEAVRKEYDKGTDSHVGFLELQDARQKYNEAKLEYISKLKFYNISLARLEKATHIHSHGMHQYHDMHSLCNDKSHHNENDKKTNHK